jgi:hypothetical protein
MRFHLVRKNEGFGQAIRFFEGGVYDCVVPDEVVDRDAAGGINFRVPLLAVKF